MGWGRQLSGQPFRERPGISINERNSSISTRLKEAVPAMFGRDYEPFVYIIHRIIKCTGPNHVWQACTPPAPRVQTS